MNARIEIPTRFQGLADLGGDLPIVQAPMAGATPPRLVAAASEAGALGSFGAGYTAPEELSRVMQDIRSRTSKPFAVNLMIPSSDEPAPEAVEEMTRFLERYRTELGLKDAPVSLPDSALFDEQVDVVCKGGARVLSTTFGVPEKRHVDAAHSAGLLVVGTATCVREGRALEAVGCDAVVAQGFEAGGHRGAASAIRGPQVGGMALIPAMADALSVPVIAAGGIMDGRGLVAAFALGASAVQMGTAFLTCEEAEIHPAWYEAILASDDESTSMTLGFSGRYARGIRNRMMTEIEDSGLTVPVYPRQNFMTKDIRARAKLDSKPELMSMWAGQGTCLSKPRTVASLLEALHDEVEAT